MNESGPEEIQRAPHDEIIGELIRIATEQAGLLDPNRAERMKATVMAEVDAEIAAEEAGVSVLPRPKGEEHELDPERKARITAKVFDVVDAEVVVDAVTASLIGRFRDKRDKLAAAETPVLQAVETNPEDPETTARINDELLGKLLGMRPTDVPLAVVSLPDEDELPKTPQKQPSRRDLTKRPKQ